MNFLEAVLIGGALAMDALAVSLALGVSMRCAFNWRRILGTAVFFGWFQFMMPVIGWFGVSRLQFLSGTPGKIVAVLLLVGLGGKMIADAWGKDDGKTPAFGWGRVTLLALATSIDALVVGVSYGCLARPAIWADAAIIGVVTLLISAAGGVAGRWAGCLLGRRSGCIGGVVLILIAMKILFME